MGTKRKAAKKPTPAKKATKPTTKAATKVNSSNKQQKGKTMNEKIEAAITAILAILTSVCDKLGELVQIETFLANKALDVGKPALASVPAVAVPAAAAAQPATRPGAGTVGGLVWDFCDGLNKQLGRAPTKEELLAAIKQYSPSLNGQPVNELTAATQYSKWRGSQGLPKLPRGFGAQRQAAAPAAATAQPVPSAPTIGAPAPVAALAPVPQQLPIPAAAVPSVIQPVPPAPAPAPVAATNLPPWLRAQG